MWTVIMFFNRGKQTIEIGLTKEQAKGLIDIAVFHNEDCVNVHCFKTEG